MFLNYLIIYSIYVFIYFSPIFIYKIMAGKEIKGIIDEKGEKIYFTKEHELYYKIKTNSYFRTEKAAEKAGFKKYER